MFVWLALYQCAPLHPPVSASLLEGVTALETYLHNLDYFPLHTLKESFFPYMETFTGS